MRTDGWREIEATVYTCGWQDEVNVGAAGTHLKGHYLIVFSYEVNGEWYSGEFKRNSPVQEGSLFPLRYDPDNPKRNEFSLTELDDKRISIITYVVGAILCVGYILYKLWGSHIIR